MYCKGRDTEYRGLDTAVQVFTTVSRNPYTVIWDRGVVKDKDDVEVDVW